LTKQQLTLGKWSKLGQNAVLALVSADGTLIPNLHKALSVGGNFFAKRANSFFFFIFTNVWYFSQNF
jgi:hypothetical protein